MDSDSETSNRSSSPSASPGQQSPSQSLHAEPSLHRLTTHFVNAKRSLSTTHHIFRANELVTSSRTLVEEIAVLHARNDFASRAAEDGLNTLEDIRWGIGKEGDDVEAEFRRVVEGLDEANERLLKTLDKLRGTVVDASLQRKDNSSNVEASRDDDEEDGSDGPQASQEERTLLAFIDTSKHESIQSALRTQIDDFYTARGDLSTSLETFAKDIHVLHAMLSPPPSSPEPPDLLRPALYDEPAPTISQLFHSVTDNASTMASLLQSLVSHYDLCVTALKHTEGGGEAARKAVQEQRTNSPSASAQDNLLPKSQEKLEESLYRKPHASPMSADEKREMLQVLEHDSAEVEDVVSELGDHARNLESAFDKLAARARKARDRDRTLRHIVTLLHEMQDLHLPSHLHGLRTFEQDWSRIKAAITSSTTQLSDLSDFYGEFYHGYGKLLREVERRRQAEQHMRRIAEKASREIGRVWEADRVAREEFMQGVGGVLPGDLWPSLYGRARRWGVVEVDEEEGVEGDGDGEEG